MRPSLKPVRLRCLGRRRRFLNRAAGLAGRLAAAGQVGFDLDLLLDLARRVACGVSDGNQVHLLRHVGRLERERRVVAFDVRHLERLLAGDDELLGRRLAPA